MEASLDVVVEEVGGKALEGGGGLPAPALLNCSRRLPATCRGTIECPPAEDSRPELEEVCRWLATEGKAALRPDERGDEICTEQYGGPEIAHVTGTLDGQRIDATFTRLDGCEISRYDRAAPLWTGVIPDDGGGADDGGAPAIEPEVIDDPPEAFGR